MAIVLFIKNQNLKNWYIKALSIYIAFFVIHFFSFKAHATLTPAQISNAEKALSSIDFSTSALLRCQKLLNNSHDENRMLQSQIQFEQRIKSSFKVSDGDRIYYEFIKSPNPINQSKTILIENGFVLPLDRLHSLARSLNEMGYSVLLVARRTQSESIVEHKKNESKASSFAPGKSGRVRNIISAYRHVQDQVELLHSLNINKVHIIGVSYGSLLTKTFAEFFPDMIERVSLLVPLVASSDNYSEAKEKQRQFENMLSLVPLWGQFAIEGTREYIATDFAKAQASAVMNFEFVENYLKQNKDPQIEEDLWAGIYSDLRIAEDFDARNGGFAKIPKLSFIFAGEESPERLRSQFLTYHVDKVIRGYTRKTPNLYFIEGTEHDGFTRSPQAIARAVDQEFSHRSPSLSRIYYMHAQDQNLNIQKLNKSQIEILSAEIQLQRLSHNRPTPLEKVFHPQLFLERVHALETMLDDLSVAIEQGISPKIPVDQDIDFQNADPLRPFAHLRTRPHSASIHSLLISQKFKVMSLLDELKAL